MERFTHDRLLSRARLTGAHVWLTAALVLPSLVTLGGLVESRRAYTAKRPACERVQALVGGHGLGAVTVAAWCTFTFDPRSEPLCSCPVWPVPGGPCFCPDHAASVIQLEEPIAVARVPIARPRQRERRAQ